MQTQNARCPPISRRQIVVLLVTATMQAGALTVLAASGAGARPWSAAALFGLGAAGAASAVAWIAGPTWRHPRVATWDACPYDAITLALLLAASTFVGGVEAMLLLPAVTIVSRVVRRISKRRTADQWDANLLLIVLIALAGLCNSGGWQPWTAVGALLITTPILRTFVAYPHLKQTPLAWQAWAKTSALCMAIAFRLCR